MNTILVEVTTKCLHKCAGCCNHFDGNIEIDYDILSKFLDYARRYCNKLTLCGGDPLLYSKLHDLLEFAKAKDYFISLDTVGYNISEDLDQTIPTVSPRFLSTKVDMLGLCIDGSTNQIAQSFRTNYIDIIDRQLNLLSFLENYKLNICINTVVSKKNYYDLKNIYNLIKNFNNIKKWQLFEFVATGNGYKNRDVYEIADYDNIVDDLLSQIDNSKFLIQKKHKNARSTNYILITPKGTAIIPDPDNNSNIEIGNIKNQSTFDTIIAEILKSNEHRSIYE